VKKRTQLILLTLLWLLPGWLPAQTNATSRAASTRRFLFVLETSRAMQRRSESDNYRCRISQTPNCVPTAPPEHETQ